MKVIGRLKVIVTTLPRDVFEILERRFKRAHRMTARFAAKVDATLEKEGTNGQEKAPTEGEAT